MSAVLSDQISEVDAIARKRAIDQMYVDIWRTQDALRAVCPHPSETLHKLPSFAGRPDVWSCRTCGKFVHRAP